MNASAHAALPGYGTIVVTLDGSSLSESALPIAAAIARAGRGAVHLVRVHEPIIPAYVGIPMPDLDDEARDTERAHLTELARRLAREHGITAEAHLLDVPVGRSIAQYVRTSGAGLVVITTHGRTGLSRTWLGSTADWLMRFLPVPVLMLRPHEAVSEAAFLAPVLVALDGSERSERIVPEAVRLARLGAARLTLLHVVAPVAARVVPFGSPTIPAVYDEGRTDEALRQAKAQLDVLAKWLRHEHAGLEVTTEAMVSDRVAETILRRAGELGAKVIALSTRGRGASRLLVGSVADKVLRGFDGLLLALGPVAMRELESDYVVAEAEPAAGWQ